MQSNTKIAVNYWTNLYSAREQDCINRVSNLAKDFIASLSGQTPIKSPILRANNILEFGCGTGHLCSALSKINKKCIFVGADISTSAINIANKYHFENERLYFIDKDILYEKIDGHFDLVISSNTLEHFKDPFLAIEKLFEYGDSLLLLLPYDEKNIQDKYDVEGGAGHVYSFNENSFGRYKVIGWYTFFTHEWVQGENPLQMVILIKKR